MKLEEYKRISKALCEITRSKFMEILLPHYNDNRDYTIGLWDSFDDNRLGFCMSRNPIEPGNALIEFAIADNL